MKKITLILIAFVVFACNKQEKQVVEISCGQCQFNLKTQDGCDLAVRFNDKAYFVDGANIDDYGDAHDKDTGFCEAIRHAEVSGKVVDNRYKIETLELLD